MSSTVRKAEGFQPVKQFQHKGKHRVEGDDSRQTQGLRISNWVAAMATTNKVDIDRLNERGTLYTQPFDPKPRIRITDRRYDELVKKFGGRQ